MLVSYTIFRQKIFVHTFQWSHPLFCDRLSRCILWHRVQYIPNFGNSFRETKRRNCSGIVAIPCCRCLRRNKWMWQWEISKVTWIIKLNEELKSASNERNENLSSRWCFDLKTNWIPCTFDSIKNFLKMLNCILLNTFIRCLVSILWFFQFTGAGWLDENLKWKLFTKKFKYKLMNEKNAFLCKRSVN